MISTQGEDFAKRLEWLLKTLKLPLIKNKSPASVYGQQYNYNDKIVYQNQLIDLSVEILKHYNELKKKNEDLEQKYEKKKGERKKQIKELKENLSSKENEISLLKYQINSLSESHKKTLKEQTEELKNVKNELQKMNEKKELFNELQKYIDQIFARNNQQFQGNLEQRNYTHQLQMSNKEKEVNNLYTSILYLKQLFDSCEKKQDDRQNLLNFQFQYNQDMKLAHYQNENNLEKIKKQIESNELSNLKIEISKLQMQIQNLQNDNNKLQHQLQQSNIQLEKLRCFPQNNAYGYFYQHKAQFISGNNQFNDEFYEITVFNYQTNKTNVISVNQNLSVMQFLEILRQEDGNLNISTLTKVKIIQFDRIVSKQHWDKSLKEIFNSPERHWNIELLSD